LPKASDLDFNLHVNSEKRQESNTKFLIFDIPKLIEFASKFYTLYPGDLYYTGTPEGVGPVKPGDWISLKSVPQLGELKIQVRAHQTGG
jgi:2-keto-4-pentenoate hydratase/2-oxohepta-3-ene-1,7-dioic acid hydratase in catechol pathway